MQQISIRLKLTPDEDSRERLLALMRDFNECCNWIALEAWIAQKFRRFDLHHLVYYRAREVFGLRGQTTCAAIAKVAAAYKLPKNRPVVFRPRGTVEFHEADFRFTNGQARFATLGGFISVAFVGRAEYEGLISQHGQPKLYADGGQTYLIVPVTVETPEASAVDTIGVDLGIANIATDSNGTRYCGAALRGIRYRRRRLRAKLQSKGTKSAKRVLKRLRRREARFARDVNHSISKKIVANAERTKSAVALEELRHIRSRVRVSGKQQRATLHSWSFGQLRSFITYKANLAGVPVILVDPKNTSRECSSCGHVDKRNRPDQATFKCRLCGFSAHADYNAALVIRSRAQLNAPYAAGSHLAASPFVDS